MTNTKLLWRPAAFSAVGEGFQADDTLHDGIHLRWFLDHRLGLPYVHGGVAKGEFRIFIQRHTHRTVVSLDLFTMPIGGLYSVRTNRIYSNEAGMSNTGSRMTFWKAIDPLALRLFWRFNYQMGLLSMLWPQTPADREFRRYAELVMNKLQPKLVSSVLSREESEACAIDLRYYLSGTGSSGQDDPHLRLIGCDRNNRPVAADWVGITKTGLPKSIARLRAPGIAAVILEPVEGRALPTLDEVRWILCEDYCQQEDLWYTDAPMFTRFQADPSYHTKEIVTEHYRPFRHGIDPSLAADAIQNQLIGDPELQTMLIQPTTYTMAQYGIDHEVFDAATETGATMRLPILQSLVTAAIDPAVARILGLYAYLDSMNDLDGSDIKIEANLPFFDPNNLDELNAKLNTLSGDWHFDFFIDANDTLIGTRLCALVLAPYQAHRDLPWIPSTFETQVRVTDLPSADTPDKSDLFVNSKLMIPIEIDVTQPYRMPIAFGLERRTRNQDWIDVIRTEETAPDVLDELGILPPVYFPDQETNAWDSTWGLPDTFRLPALQDEIVQYRLRAFDIFGRSSPPKEGDETPIPLPCHAPASPAHPGCRIVREGDILYLELTFGLDSTLQPLEAPWEALEVIVHRLPTDPVKEEPPGEVQWSGERLAQKLTIPILYDHQLHMPIGASCWTLSWQAGTLVYTAAPDSNCHTEFPPISPEFQEVVLESMPAAKTGYRTYQVRLAVGDRSSLEPDLYRWCARLRVRGRCPESGEPQLSPETCVASNWLMTPPAAQPARPLTAQIPVSTFPDRLGDSYYTLDLSTFGLAAGDLVNIYMARLDHLSPTATTLVEDTQLNDVAQLLALARASNQPYERLATLPVEYNSANRFFPIKIPGDLRHYYVIAVAGANQYGQEQSWSDAAIVLFTTPQPLVFPQLLLEEAESYVEAGQPKFRLTCSVNAASLNVPQVRVMRRDLSNDGSLAYVTQVGGVQETGADGDRYRFRVIDNTPRDWRTYEYWIYLLLNIPYTNTFLTGPDRLRCVAQAPWGGLRSPFGPTDFLTVQPSMNSRREVVTTFDAGEFDFTLTKLKTDHSSIQMRGAIRGGKVSGLLEKQVGLRTYTSGAMDRYELTLRDEDKDDGQYILRLSYGQEATWTNRENR
jgi:hypothetical protein